MRGDAHRGARGRAHERRPALSILGHCHYHLGEFDLAAQMYERLSRLRPEDASVKLYHAQSLFKAGARAD